LHISIYIHGESLILGERSASPVVQSFPSPKSTRFGERLPLEAWKYYKPDDILQLQSDRAVFSTNWNIQIGVRYPKSSPSKIGLPLIDKFKKSSNSSHWMLKFCGICVLKVVVYRKGRRNTCPFRDTNRGTRMTGAMPSVGEERTKQTGYYAEDRFKHEPDLRWRVRFLTVMSFPL